VDFSRGKIINKESFVASGNMPIAKPSLLYMDSAERLAQSLLIQGSQNKVVDIILINPSESLKK